MSVFNAERQARKQRILIFTVLVLAQLELGMEPVYPILVTDAFSLDH